MDICVPINISVTDEHAFRLAAYQRAVEIGMSDGTARDYLNAESTSMANCATILIQPVSPPGSQVHEAAHSEQHPATGTVQIEVSETIQLSLAVLTEVLNTSLFLRWRQFQGMNLELLSSADTETFIGDEGAYVRLSGKHGLDGKHGVFDLSVFRRGHLWFVHFGNIEDDAERGMNLGGCETIIIPQTIVQWLDSDDVAATHCWAGPEFHAFLALRSLEIALRASHCEEGIDADEMAMLESGSTTKAQLRDWVDDLGHREGVDVRDFRSRIEAYIEIAARPDPGQAWLLNED